MLARLWQTRSGRIATWSLLVLLALISLGIDWNNVAQGGSIDLRNRVTGTRLLLDHLDPYFYKWHEPEPPEDCDPYNNPQLPVSKTTATPALLLLDLPVAVFPYRTGQFFWFFLQWACLVGASTLWAGILPTEPHRLALAAFATGFTYTAAWRLHAERGQAYVLLLFLFALWLTFTLRGQKKFMAGLLAGILAALRPPFLLLLPFLAGRRREQLSGFVVGLLLAVLLPMFFRADIWLKYEHAMQEHSALYRQGIDPAPGPERFPATIENMPTDLLAHYVAIPYADFSVHGLLRALGLEPAPAWPPLALVGAASLAWLGWKRAASLELLLAGVTTWLFLLDLTLPAYRNIYNDVLCLNLFAFALLKKPANKRAIGLLLLTLPAGWAVDYFAPMNDALIDLPSACCTAGAVALLF
jgi:hypothetical protein